MPWAAARGRVAGAVWCQSALFGIEFVNDDLIGAQIGNEQEVVVGVGADEVRMGTFLSFVVWPEARVTNHGR